MRTNSNPAASHWSRVVHVSFILWLICGPDVVLGQPVHLEWLKYENNGVRYLALNAFDIETELRPRGPLASEYASPARQAFHRLDGAAIQSVGTHVSRTVYPLIIEQPLRSVPDSPEARALLDVLEKVDDVPGPTSSWKPKSLEQWENLLRVLTTRNEIWLHGRVIRSREVAGVLKDIYAVRGYPSPRRPIFPHLERGVLAVLDSDGRPLTSIEVGFDQERSDAPIYRTVTFANVGSEPLRVYTEQETLAPIRVSGAPSLLRPTEHISTRLTLEQSVFAITRQESKMLVRYVSGGVELDAFEVRAHHSGWMHSASAALAGTTALVFGVLNGLGVPHMPIAAAGLLISLLIIAVLRISADAAAPGSAGRSPVKRLRSFGQHLAAELRKLAGGVISLLHAARGAGLRLSDRTSEELIDLKDRSASSRAAAVYERCSGVASTVLGNLTGWISSSREDARRNLTSLHRTSSRGAAVLWRASIQRAGIFWEASVRGMAQLREASVEAMVSIREVSSPRLASLQKASSRYAASLMEASSRQVVMLRQASVESVESLRAASGRGMTSLREASGRGVASLREASGRGVTSLREASGRGVAKLRTGMIRLNELITREAALISSVLRHGFPLPVRRRSVVYFSGLFERAARAWKRALVRVQRLRLNLHLYREFVSEPIPPRDGKECVDRVRRIAHELRSKSTTSFSRSALRRLLKETTCMARRLESDLAHGRVPQTTINFQILWALRLLLEILNGPPRKVSASVHRWLDGADRVLRNGAHDGVGPTVPEFLSLVTPEYEIGGRL